MNKNIGLIKESLFNDFSKNIVNKTELKEVTKKFDNFNSLLKESTVLTRLYNIYENIENKFIEDKDEAKDYLRENLELLSDVSHSKLEKELNKLEKFDISENVETDRKELFEHITDYIVESKKNMLKRDVNKIHDSKKKLVEYITNNKNFKQREIIKEDVDYNDEFIKYLSENMEKEIDEHLNEDEKKIFYQTVGNTDEQNKTFYENEKINLIETLEILCKHVNTEEEHYINETIEKVKEMTYGEEDFLENITEMRKLKKDLKS